MRANKDGSGNVPVHYTSSNKRCNICNFFDNGSNQRTMFEDPDSSVGGWICQRCAEAVEIYNEILDLEDPVISENVSLSIPDEEVVESVNVEDLVDLYDKDQT